MSAAVDYAFGNQKEIKNPADANSQYWNRTKLDAIVAKSQQLSSSYCSFQSSFQQKLQEVENENNLKRQEVKGGAILANSVLDYNENEALRPLENAKNEALFKLKQNKERR